jgi:hypothetical protein
MHACHDRARPARATICGNFGSTVAFEPLGQNLAMFGVSADRAAAARVRRYRSWSGEDAGLR